MKKTLEKIISVLLILLLVFSAVNPANVMADEDVEITSEAVEDDPTQDSPQGTDIPEDDPKYIEIKSSSNIISFGHVNRGNPMPYQEFTITSYSSETIYLDYQLCDAEDIFYVGSGDSLSLAPGQSTSFFVGIDENKPQGYYTANLIICPIDYIAATLNIGLSVEIVDNKPIITYIGVKPSSVEMNKNSTYRFVEEVRGENDPNYGVGWSVEGNTSTNTTVDSDGVLKIGQNETASQITVRATSVQDRAWSATATVRILEGSYAVSTQSYPNDGGTTGGGGMYAPGGTVEVYAAPNNGYRFTKWTRNGKTVSTNAKYQINNIRDNYDLVANFEKANCYVKVNAIHPEGGTVSQSGNVNYNGAYELSASPNNGFVFEGWYENGKRFSTNKKVTINNIVTNREFTANFVQNAFKVQIQTNPQGTGVVTGEGSYATGTKITVAAKPIEGYEFDCWTVNGVLITRDNAYSFSNLDRDLVFVANFKKKSAVMYTINSKVDAGQGTITPAGVVSVPEGMDVTYTFAPAKDYTVSAVTADGKNVGAIPSYTFKGVRGDHSISVKFAKISDSHIHVDVQPAKTEAKKEEPKEEHKEEHKEEKHEDIVDNTGVAETETVDSEEEYKPDMVEEEDLDYFLGYTELTGILQEYNITEEEARTFIQNKIDASLLERACQEQYLAVSVSNEYADIKQETENTGYSNIESAPNFGEVVDSLLTEDEKIEVLKGGRIAINFNLFSNNKLETGDNKLLVNRAIKDKVEIGNFFEAVLIKDTPEGSQMVTQLDVPMKIVLNIPQVLKAEGREFFIMRSHKNDDGTVDIDYLENESTDSSKIVFTTDRFSSYAIAYKGGKSETLTQNSLVKILFVVITVAVIITIALIVVLIRFRRHKKKHSIRKKSETTF